MMTGEEWDAFAAKLLKLRECPIDRCESITMKNILQDNEDESVLIYHLKNDHTVNELIMYIVEIVRNMHGSS